MKLGPIEGTKEEITGFFQDNGLKASDYFQAPETPIRTVWLAIPAVLLVLALGALSLVEPFSPGQRKFAFLAGCMAAIWLTTVVQLRFKQTWATGIIAIGSLLLMLVALGDISPGQVLEEVKSMQK